MTETKNLTRMTCDYSASEDRVRIRGLVSDLADSADDSTHELWLTQRLALRLVAALINVLERSELATSSGLTLRQRADVHSLKQEHVTTKSVTSSESVVRLDGDSLSWLVTHIDLTEKSGKLMVVLRNLEHRLKLELNEVVLRQWLNILFHIFQQAQWPMVVWPEWFLENERGMSRRAIVH